MRARRNPFLIPPRSWKNAVVRTKNEVKKDHIPIVASGMAFWAMLAIFPALIALVSLYGLVADPATVERQLASLSQMLPGSARDLIATQLQDIVQSSSSTLGLGLVVAVLGALWSASAGTKTAIAAINMAYDQEENRGFFKLRGLALGLTAGALLLVAMVIVLIAVVPALFDTLGLGAVGRAMITYGRWPLMALFVMVGIGILYRTAPCREGPRWAFVTPGSIVATLLWLGLTALFSFYVSRFGSYNETYGALGGVIVLLLWFYLSSFVVLVGAELNAELEREAGELPKKRAPERSTEERLAPPREREATTAYTGAYRPSHP